MYYAVIKEKGRKKYFDGKKFLIHTKNKKVFPTIANMIRFFNNFKIPRNRMLYSEQIL